MFNVAVEDAGFPGQRSKRNIKDLITMTLAAVCVDINGDRDNGEEKLMFDGLVLVEEFI